MTDAETSADRRREEQSGSRRATITTTHDDPTTAARVAAALRPDNTTEMATRTADGRVVTTIDRDSTGGLRSTMDDYVVNATVATRLATDADADPETNAAAETDEDTHDTHP